MVVCDDRDVMRLGLVEMLQEMHWAADLKGFSSLPIAWTYLAGSSATSAIAILGGTSAAEELAATGRPTRPPTRIVLMLRDSEAAHLAVAVGLPVDGFFLEEDLSVSMLRALLARLDEREFPMPAPMAEFLLGQLRAPRARFRSGSARANRRCYNSPTARRTGSSPTSSGFPSTGSSTT
jgi:hypothetical protein